jgi:hypothetical protein
VSSRVLIASPEHLAALKERDDLEGAVAFSDGDALRALEMIMRQRPGVVALERMFASTSRGAALINRIKADPSLASCEIRIVAHDSDYSRVSPRRPADAPAAAAPAAVAVAEAPRTVTAPLDQRGTRRAPRYKIGDGVEVQIDGNPASLVDLSLVGAQVISPTILKPNQRVRMLLADGPRPMRFSGAVAWASFEIRRTALSGRDRVLRRRSGSGWPLHRSAQEINPFSLTIVSARSEPVDTIAHATPLTSSSRRTYCCASAGSRSKRVQPFVGADQPGIVS